MIRAVHSSSSPQRENRPGRISAFGVLLSVSLWVAPGNLARGAEVDHVVLISIDGLLPAYYMEPALASNFPALSRFKKEGSYASSVIGVLPTLTFPSHTTLVSGVVPACHGITTNLIFDPMKQNRGGWQWYEEDIRSDTLWRAANRRGLKTGSVFWPVTVGAKIDYLLPAFWQIGGGLDTVRLLRALSTPGLMAEIERQFGAYSPGSQTDLDRLKIGRAVFLQSRPALMLIKLSDLDDAQHRHGPESEQAVETLKKIDAGLSEFLQALDASGLSKSTVVAVASDHGATRVSKALRPEHLFLEKGWIRMEAGRIVDWRATPVVAGGLCAVVLRNPDDGKTLGEVRSLFQALQQSGDHGIRRIYEKSEIAAGGGFPDASLLIECEPGYRMETGFQGPPVVVSNDQGAHGYAPDFPGQAASFLLLGPSIAPGRNLGELKMTDIAPRLASLLGLSLESGPCPASERP